MQADSEKQIHLANTPKVLKLFHHGEYGWWPFNESISVTFFVDVAHLFKEKKVTISQYYFMDGARAPGKMDHYDMADPYTEGQIVRLGRFPFGMDATPVQFEQPAELRLIGLYQNLLPNKTKYYWMYIQVSGFSKLRGHEVFACDLRTWEVPKDLGVEYLLSDSEAEKYKHLDH